MRHRFALVLLPLLAAVPFLGPLLRGEVLIFRDHFDYFLPLRWFTATSLRAGSLPLWNPYSMSGEPWMANPQTGVFYPPTWLFLALPFPTAYVLYLLLHVAILGIGAYLLFEREASPGAALVGAVALMFAGPTLSLLDVSNNLTTFAWIPWVLWCALERRPGRAAVFLALAFLAGEPFFAGIAALLFIIISRNAKEIAIAGLGAFGLAAVQIVPFVEMLRGSDRDVGFEPSQIFRDSMPPADWLRLAVPPWLGGAGQTQHFIPIVYAGVIVALLAVVGFSTSWRRTGVRAWLVLLAFCVIVSAGPHIAPVAELIASLPVTLFRYPARFVPFGTLAIVAIAVIGWQSIRREKRWLDLLVIALIVVDVVPATRILFASAPFTTDVVPYERRVGETSKLIRIGNQSPFERERWLSGYLNLYQHRFDETTAAPVANARAWALHKRLVIAPHGDLLAFVPIGWVLTTRQLAPPFVRESRLGDVTLFHNPHMLPMATLWMHASAARSEEEAFAALVDGRLGGDLLVTPRVDAAIANGVRDVRRARITELDASRVRVTLDALAPGILVVAQQDSPGWKVSVDGQPAEKLLANGIFRAVAVEKGRHDVLWTYRPASFLLGGVMTLITLSAMLFSSFVKRARRGKFVLLSHEL